MSMPAAGVAALALLLAFPQTTAAKNKPEITVLFFTAPWCEPCRAVDLLLEKLQRRNRKYVRIVNVDFDAAADERARWGVEQIPVVIVLSREGVLLLRADGASRQTLSALESGLAELIHRPRKRSPP
jgi:thioredoxin-like negative regulator of GroEL